MVTLKDIINKKNFSHFICANDISRNLVEDMVYDKRISEEAYMDIKNMKMLEPKPHDKLHKMILDLAEKEIS